VPAFSSASEELLTMRNQGYAASTTIGSLRSQARWTAMLYCNKQKKTLSVLRYEDAAGPFYGGSFPSTDLVFKCE
jgi:hypothetical protein